MIKVEAPGGDGCRAISTMPGNPVDPVHGYVWQVDNRSKRGLCLDLTTDDGRAVMDRLLDGADVLITNFLPRVRRKLGLTWQEAVRTVSPADLCLVQRLWRGGAGGRKDRLRHDGFMGAHGTGRHGPFGP